MAQPEVRHFAVGDRVQLCISLGLLAKGSAGTITRVYQKLDCAYDVEFQTGLVWFIFERYLEPILEQAVSPS